MTFSCSRRSRPRVRRPLGWRDGRTRSARRPNTPTTWPAGSASQRTRAGLRAGARGQGSRSSRPTELPERYRLQLAGEPELAAELFRAEDAIYDAAVALVPSMNGRWLRSALGQLHALGAKPAAANVSRRLRELGERRVPRGPRPSTSENPAGLDQPRARGSAAARGGTAQRRDRQASGPLAEDGRPPRLRDLAKTRRQHPRPGRRRRWSARPDPEDDRSLVVAPALSRARRARLSREGRSARRLVLRVGVSGRCRD